MEGFVLRGVLFSSEPRSGISGVPKRQRVQLAASVSRSRNLNDALIVAFVAGLLAAMLHGAGYADARAVSYLAMAIWAYAELVDGVNWFRHLLGLGLHRLDRGASAAALGH